MGAHITHHFQEGAARRVRQVGPHNQKEANMPKFFSLREIADTLKIKPAVVRDWVRREKLPAVRFGKTYRVRADAVEQLFEHGVPVKA
jgi:excisionase family DNA binding protein